MEFLILQRWDLSLPPKKASVSSRQSTRNLQRKSKQRKRIMENFTVVLLNLSLMERLSRSTSVSCRAPLRVPPLHMGVQLEIDSASHGHKRDGSVPMCQAAQYVKGVVQWLAKPCSYLVDCVRSVCKATATWRKSFGSFGRGGCRSSAQPKVPLVRMVGEDLQVSQRNDDQNEDQNEDLYDIDLPELAVVDVPEQLADTSAGRDSAQASDQPFEEGSPVDYDELEVTIPDNSVVDLPEQVGCAENQDQGAQRRVTIAFEHTAPSGDLQHSMPSSDSVAQQDSSSTGASVPRPIRLLMPFGIIAFGYLQAVLNNVIQALAKFLDTDLSYEQILEILKQPVQHAAQHDRPFSQELDNLQMMFATQRAIHCRQVSISLLIDVSKDVERFVLQMLAPITDTPILGPIPFHSELVYALNDKSISVFQIDFPSAISEDQVIPMLLLLAKVLTESVVDSGLLGSLECEDQSVILLGNSAFLVSNNHMLDVLLKLFPGQAVGYCIIASPSQKRFADIVESFLNEIPRCFRSKFTTPSYRITELFRQLSPSVVAAEESSEVATYTTPSLMVPAPQLDDGPLSAGCEYSCDAVPVAQACEETGSGKSVCRRTLYADFIHGVAIVRELVCLGIIFFTSNYTK